MCLSGWECSRRLKAFLVRLGLYRHQLNQTEQTSNALQATLRRMKQTLIRTFNELQFHNFRLVAEWLQKMLIR